MNRFSPKQILSNIATAVRETVDSVNGNFIATVMAMLAAVTLCATASAQSGGATLQPGAQTGGFGVRPVEDQLRYDAETEKREDARKEKAMREYNEACGGEKQNTQDCARYMTINRLTPPSSGQCDRYSTEIAKYSDRATESCTLVDGTNFQKCVTKVLMCVDAEAQANEYNEDADNESSEYCDAALANKCPALPSFMNGRNYRQDKTDAETERKEAKRELDDLMDDERKDKAATAKQQLEIQEQQENAEAEFQKRQSDLNKKMVEALEGITNSQKQAFRNAQEATDAMEIDFVNMRAEARAAAASIILAEEKQKLFCTDDADKRYKAADDARLAAERKGRKNLGTAVSGASKRNKNAVKQQQQIDYQKFYEQCMGKSTEASIALKAAKLEKEAKEKLVAEKTRIIEGKRLKMQADLQKMEEESKNQQSKVVEQIQEEFKSLQTEKARVDAQNQRRLSQMASNNLQASLAMQNRIGEANRRLMTTQTEAALSLTRMNCAGRIARTSESQQDKNAKAYGSAASDVKNLKNLCLRADRAGCKGFETECKEAVAVSMELKSKDKYQPKESGDGVKR